MLLHMNIRSNFCFISKISKVQTWEISQICQADWEPHQFSKSLQIPLGKRDLFLARLSQEPRERCTNGSKVYIFQSVPFFSSHYLLAWASVFKAGTSMSCSLWVFESRIFNRVGWVVVDRWMCCHRSQDVHEKIGKERRKTSPGQANQAVKHGFQ